MRERKRRIDTNLVIEKLGKMHPFNASLMGVMLRIGNDTAYHWIWRNTGKILGREKDLLISWVYENKLYGMFVPKNFEIRGMNGFTIEDDKTYLNAE